MQIANILLSLGGDHGNTVPKFAVTAAEISVLRAIHGDESVKDVEPIGDVKRSHRDERGRLLNIYGAAKTADHKPIVEGMFPGIAARVFESLQELDLPESFFKAVGHLKASPSEPVYDPSAPLEIDRAAFLDEPAVQAEADEDGVGDDIHDEHAEPNVLG